MTVQALYFVALAITLLLVLVKAAWVHLETGDLPCTYKLFAARDQLIRLVVEGKISRDDPYFHSMYTNVNTLLRSSRLISGPVGWPLAKYSGQVFAHQPSKGAKLVQFPGGNIPKVLLPIANDMSHALRHLVDNHMGIWLQTDSIRRELIKIHKEQAKQFLVNLPTQKFA
jgi:hypothetical protein